MLEYIRSVVWAQTLFPVVTPTNEKTYTLVLVIGGQALPADMLSKNTEALKSMNSQTAKFAKWYVRVLDPKVIEYSFSSKGEEFQAKKFQCVLVSHAPEQYMLGLVPFDFKNRTAATTAAAKFTHDSIWELTKPAFDAKSKPEFNGCPVKSVVLLTKPTTTTRVPPTSTAALAYPAKGLHVALDIKGIIDLLRRTADGNPERKSFDFCGKFLGMGESRLAGRFQVADAEFTDAGGWKIVVSVWTGARAYFNGISNGTGVAVLGCSAALQDNAVKINVWPGAHVCTSGEQAQSLTSLDSAGASAEVLTATFTPGCGLAAIVDEEAHPTCAAVLAAAALADAIVEEEVRTHIDAQSLAGVKERLNVRGVIRAENGSTKRYIMEIGTAPLTAVVSMAATRLCRGLSEVARDVVLPVPLSRILEDPLAGLAVRRDDQKIIGANRVLLLVRGTSSTKMEPIQEDRDLAKQSFKVSSTGALCLLSDSQSPMNLVGYCDFNKMLTYRLDTEAALVLASAVECPAPGSAIAMPAAGDVCPTATIEHVTKLSKDQVAALTQSLAVEWKAVLTTAAQCSAETIGTPEWRAKSSKDPNSDYWSEERQRKVRRLQSEPASPLASASALAALRDDE